MDQNLAMVICLLVQGCCMGTNAVAQKRSQEGRINGLADSLIFTTILAFFQAVIYIIVPPYTGFPAAAGFYGYTATFAVVFVTQIALYMLALRLGPASLTTTIRSLGMLVSIVLGLFVWNEPLTVNKVIGVLIFVGAIFFMNKSSYSVNGQGQKLSVRWLLISLVVLVVSGSCGFISKQVMLTFPGTQKIYLLTYNLFVLALGVPFCIVFFRRALPMLRDVRFMAMVALSALCISVSDIIFVNFVPLYDTAFYMPLISTMSLISVMVFTRIFLKERIARRSLLAAGLCVVAVFVLSI